MDGSLPVAPTWDRLDPTDSNSIAAALLAFVIVATAIAERRNYRALASVESAYREHLDAEPHE